MSMINVDEDLPAFLIIMECLRCPRCQEQRSDTNYEVWVFIPLAFSF